MSEPPLRREDRLLQPEVREMRKDRLLHQRACGKGSFSSRTISTTTSDRQEDEDMERGWAASTCKSVC